MDKFAIGLSPYNAGPAAQRLARPPISNYHVGVVGLGLSGRIYLGVNLEFLAPLLCPRRPIPRNQRRRPRGGRHLLHRRLGCLLRPPPLIPQEIRGAAEIRILVTFDGNPFAFHLIFNFLPHPFGPLDLLHKDLLLLLEPHDNEVRLLKPATIGEFCNGIGKGMEDRLRRAAELVARAGHAPYSRCLAGFAVADWRG